MKKGIFVFLLFNMKGEVGVLIHNHDQEELKRSRIF